MKLEYQDVQLEIIKGRLSLKIYLFTLDDILTNFVPVFDRRVDYYFFNPCP